MDKEVFLHWHLYFEKKKGYTLIYYLGRDSIFLGDKGLSNITINNSDSLLFLEKQADNKDFKLEYLKPVIYCDPPYLLETRSSGSRYKHEMTVDDHERFLNAVTKIDAPVLVSHYKNDMYDSHLKGWNTISFMSQTRSGKPRRETVYFNYEKPTELHDYSYFGNCYRERENNKKRAANIVAKFERMKPLERNYYLNALQQSGVISHR